LHLATKNVLCGKLAPAKPARTRNRPSAHFGNSLLGPALCIENMDKRKPVGRSADELDYLFQQLPQAKLCLDVGHSRQVDPSMLETWQILKIHGARLAEIHLSEVNCASKHEPLNRLAIRAFQRIASLIPDEVPIILESPVSPDKIASEIRHARQALPSRALISA